MKKILLLILGATLLTPLAQAKDLPELSNAIERAVASQVMPFANERVKQMCAEWPTCEEWIENKVQQNSSFRVLDTEIERWVNKWKNEEPIWAYRLYIQVQENNQTKVYLFKRPASFFYLAPIVVKKFPGHPGKPTEHISILKSVPNRNYHTYYLSLCNSWPGCNEWALEHDIYKAIFSQYIYKYDAQGNALWKRRLWIQTRSWFSYKYFYFQAYQTKTGGDYTYQAPIETKNFPFDRENF